MLMIATEKAAPRFIMIVLLMFLVMKQCELFNIIPLHCRHFHLNIQVREAVDQIANEFEFKTAEQVRSLNNS